MTIEKEAFGHCPEGPVERITVESNSGIAVSAITYGAVITSVVLPDRTGTREEVTLGFDSIEGYLGEHPYYGSTVGRVANRISGAQFELNGKKYTLDDTGGGLTLHGGREGFNRKLWTAEIFGESDEAGVVFRRVSPDGEGGFPGNLTVSVRMSLTERGELTLAYEAETDAPTPINLTNHTYWNLTGAPRNRVLGHYVTLHPDHYLPTGEGQIPTGEVRPVEGDPHDFRSPKTVGAEIDRVPGGYDVCYLYRQAVDQPDRRAAMSADELLPLARVEEPERGRTMEVHSTLPGIQFYTGNKLEGAPARDGGTLPIHAGMCFETQFLPDAMNQPAFPSPILMPGETFSHRTVHLFGTA